MSTRQHAIDLLKFVRGVTLGVMKDWPSDKLAFQTSPADNHPLWVMGHLANTDAWFAGVLGAPEIALPARYMALFDMGSKPAPDAGAYPPAEELRREFERSRKVILGWAESAPDAAFKADLKEKTGGFASDPLDALFKVAWHEGWHGGQVATLRKALGLPSFIG